MELLYRKQKILCSLSEFLSAKNQILFMFYTCFLVKKLQKSSEGLIPEIDGQPAYCQEENKCMSSESHVQRFWYLPHRDRSQTQGVERSGFVLCSLKYFVPLNLLCAVGKFLFDKCG